MATNWSDPEQLECPVCNEDYVDPKMLPCMHLVCRKCMVSWLGKTDGDGGCPLCRDPVIRPGGIDKSDLAAFVDSLPTELTVAFSLESQKLLSGSHVCIICEKGVVAESYCFQCCIKLCSDCTANHKKFPAFRKHTLNKLDQLTVQQLKDNHHSVCFSHPDKAAELYCTSHSKLICHVCATDDHRSCAGLKKIPEVAAIKRSELQARAKELRGKEKALSKKMEKTKKRYDGLHIKVNETFGEIQRLLEKRCQELNDSIQKEEDAEMLSFTDLNNQRSRLNTYAESLDHLTAAASDAALLEMLEKLSAQLDHLESQLCAPTTNRSPKVAVSFHPQAVALVKTTISTLGHATTENIEMSQGRSSISPPTDTPPSGATAKPEASDLSPATIAGDTRPVDSYMGAAAALSDLYHSKACRHLAALRQSQSSTPGKIETKGGARPKRKSPANGTADARTKPTQRSAQQQGQQDTDCQQVINDFRSILSKLTEENFHDLSEQIMALNIGSEACLNGVVALIHEKAIAEPEQLHLYAQLINLMRKLQKVPKQSSPEEFLTFRAILLTRCQKEFETLTAKQQAKGGEETTSPSCHRSIGNMIFIGELWRLKMITENIIHGCISTLLKTTIHNDEAFECLCKLLERIGERLDHPEAQQRMDEYFRCLEKMTADLNTNTTAQETKEPPGGLSLRVKSLVLDIINLRKNGWVKVPQP